MLESSFEEEEPEVTDDRFGGDGAGGLIDGDAPIAGSMGAGPLKGLRLDIVDPGVTCTLFLLVDED